MDFKTIKAAVARQFKRMVDSGATLLRSSINKDKMWETYLSSFPDGTNPKYRERTEHDCSCCRHFIRSTGNVVCVIDETLVSVWDVDVGNQYQVVANAMSKLVKSVPVENIFLTTEKTAGTDKNHEKTDSGVKTWDHFFLNMPSSVVAAKDVGTGLSVAKASYDVMLRSLTEITPEAVDTVLDLIAQGSLYRGEEYKRSVESFKALQLSFASVPNKELFCWSHMMGLHLGISRIRNTVIGTLLVNLSEGMDLEAAVRAFESMVAPANYKRPTALVSKAMVAKAKEKIAELGLESALNRRYAVVEDISVSNLLFANRETRNRLKEDVFDLIPTKTQKIDRTEEIGIEDFLTNVLPKATTLEVMVENDHLRRLVSLVAPCDPTAVTLFKWGNGFSWSYVGDLADSMKERVKKAGGKVDGDLRCSLSWSNYDDLDLSMVEPNANIIYFGRKESTYSGKLDVDMNAGGPQSREPVENICYSDRRKMKDGTYVLQVHNFRKRETSNVGFSVEVEADGVTHTLAHEAAMPDQKRVDVAKIHLKNGVFTVVPLLPSTQRSKDMWGITTQKFIPVSAVMLSPNYWCNGVGNKHYFFMLQGCVNDGTARGFYNEFLRSDLEPHRKVLEFVGAKVKTEASGDQLSGIGFSSTQRDHILCKIGGSFSRVVKVLF